MKSEYNKGYSDGINGREYNNQNPLRTREWNEYENGYSEGMQDLDMMERQDEVY